MKANRRALRKDEHAAAGVVAGILMLGAIVAFLAYMNISWVPVWVENKEADQVSTLNDDLARFADLAEDRVARSATATSFTVSVPLGVRGIPVLGTGSSSGESAVESQPNLSVVVSGSTVLTSAGAVSITTHTTRFPNETARYMLGALETRQTDGSFVDLRSLISVSRTSGGQLDLGVQTVNLTGAPQSVAGTILEQMTGTVTNVTTSTNTGGTVRLFVSNVQAGPWRAALWRNLNATGLVGSTAADCSAATTDYCLTASANTATMMEVTFLNVKSSWSSTVGVVAVQLRG